MNIGDRVIGTTLYGYKLVGTLTLQEPQSYKGGLHYLIKTRSRMYWCAHVTPLKTTLLKEYFKLKQ
jgi:hypothetical protein